MFGIPVFVQVFYLIGFVLAIGVGIYIFRNFNDDEPDEQQERKP